MCVDISLPKYLFYLRRRGLEERSIARVVGGYLGSTYLHTYSTYVPEPAQKRLRGRIWAEISYFSVGIRRYFSVLPIPIPENISVGIFGIKTLAGALQKIGGSPLFPKKGGPRPPFCALRPPFEEKKEFQRNFSKKRCREFLKRCSRQNLQYNNTDRKYRKPSKSDTSKIPIPKKLLVTPWYTTLEISFFPSHCKNY